MTISPKSLERQVNYHARSAAHYFARAKEVRQGLSRDFSRPEGPGYSSSSAFFTCLEYDATAEAHEEAMKSYTFLQSHTDEVNTVIGNLEAQLANLEEKRKSLTASMSERFGRNEDATDNLSFFQIGPRIEVLKDTIATLKAEESDEETK